jgi:3-mercaptopyruvate sulfurtransferase SseA
MLPDSETFANSMGGLGISDADHVVIYDSSGFGPACRVFWTFKVFGHEKVSVLNGGLVKWMLENRPVVSGPIGNHSVCSNYNIRNAFTIQTFLLIWSRIMMILKTF